MSYTFTFNDPVSCGDQEDPCVAKLTTKLGKAPVVTDSITNCDRDLIGDEYNALQVSRSNSVTELRSGSALQPLILDRLQEQLGGSIQTIVTKRSDGTIVAYKPVPVCYKRKLVVQPSGLIIPEPDVNSQIFDQSCVGSIAESTHIAMMKEFTDCAGVTRFKMVAVVTEDFLADLISQSGGDLVFDTLNVSGQLSVDSMIFGEGGAEIDTVLTDYFEPDFGTIAGNSFNTTPVNLEIPGAQGSDSVILGWQFGFPEGIVLSNPHVITTDHVNISLYNFTGTPIPFGVIGVRVTVIRFA